MKTPVYTRVAYFVRNIFLLPYGSFFMMVGRVSSALQWFQTFYSLMGVSNRRDRYSRCWSTKRIFLLPYGSFIESLKNKWITPTLLAFYSLMGVSPVQLLL